MYRRYVLLALILLAFVMTVGAQDETIPTPAVEFDPNVYIGWPPPVYVLRDEVVLYGMANAPSMISYFVEFRQLAPDLSIPDEDAAWFPATLPVTERVLADELGRWNTKVVPDGLYELRLRVNTSGGDPVFHVVSPLRVENDLPPFVETPTPTMIPTQPVPTAQPRPTLQATPTALDLTPRVTVTVSSANVRQGDSTLYNVVGVLMEGETVPVIGVSSTGSGWYYIEMPNGRRGFIASGIVQAEGNIRGTQRIDPPPPPVTNTPVPTSTPLPTLTPATTANLTVDVVVSPHPLVCGQTATVTVTVTNSGTAATNSGGAISVQAILVSSGEVLETAPAPGFGVLQPGESVVPLAIPITVNTHYNELQRIVVRVDVNNQVLESNENDNVYSTDYMMPQGGCP